MTESSFMDKETQTATRIIRLLEYSSEPLSKDITERLRGARRAALGRQRLAAAGLSLAGIGRGLEDFWFLQGRSMMMALVLIAMLGASDYWYQNSRNNELEDVDSALLSDDLPIDAYLDHGFDQWLKHEPGSGS